MEDMSWLHRDKTAREEGRKARRDGKEEKDNPYEPRTAQAVYWMYGWKDEDAKPED